jgi:periodic tryptophan protein 1
MENNNAKMMITSLAWVKRGYARQQTEQFDAVPVTNQEDMKDDQGDDVYNLKNYDNEDNTPQIGEDYVQPVADDVDIEGEDDEDMIPEQDFPQMVKDENSDDETDFIRKSDAIIVAACAEKDYSTLEVYVYEENVSNLYVHHEIMLNAYPLCLEWIPYIPGGNASFSEPGNYVAVGTFTPAIEIWNLDIVDTVEPVITLGGETEAGKSMPLQSMKAKNKKKYYNEGSHLDAVLCLSMHPTEVNILASGSADKIVKIWDLNTQKCIRDIKNHKEKVQVLQWNKNDPNTILSAGFDGKGVVTNSKNPNEKIYMQFGNTEIESGCWNPVDQYQ